MSELHHDIMSLACSDYLNGQKGAKIKVKSNIAEDDYIPVSYLFRQFSEMPLLEQKALTYCKGHVLDVGAGAGSHALWLQSEQIKVTALDVSNGLCKLMRQRGIIDVVEGDFFTLSTTQQYDTLLLLMNGIGITGKVDHLGNFFQKAGQLLNSDGQIIVDSCDIAYLFDDPETEHLPETFQHYYGEIQYQMAFKNWRGKRFNWLFIDAKLLSHLANENGWQMEVLFEGENSEFLARLTRLK